MITNINSPQPPSQIIDNGYLIISEINICDECSKNQEIENELKDIKEILNKLENKFDTLENKFDTLENKFDTLENKFDRLQNDFIYFKKAISNDKITISDVNKSDLLLLGLENNFKIKKIDQSLISQQQPTDLEPFIWKQNEKHYESTMDLNNYFHYILNQETEDYEDMFLANISNHRTALKCNVGDIVLSGSADYLLVIKEKGNIEKRCKVDSHYVRNLSNFEFSNVYLSFEVKSAPIINQLQGIAELVAITRKSNGSHPILHVSTNFGDNYIFSFWDNEGNVNWVTMERNSAIKLIQNFVLKAKEFPNESFYTINGIEIHSKSLQ